MLEFEFNRMHVHCTVWLHGKMLEKITGFEFTIMVFLFLISTAAEI